jgi:glycosyltransferase involved in cell wall biosynthesis
MSFLFVVTNLAGGGAEKVVLTLAAGLARRGRETEVVLLENRIEHSLPPGVKVVALTERASKGWLGKRLLARHLRHYVLGRESVDLVVSALPFANEVAILADLPRHWCRIDNTLGSEIDKLAANSPAKAQRRFARYRRLYGTRPLIAISEGMIDDLRRRIGVVGRIEKIPNPFDFASIRKSAQAPEPGRPTRSYVIHVGRFNAQKRHDLLLEAWKSVDTGHLLVLLTAADAKLKEMIELRGLGDRVCIAGFKPNPYPWIAGADLLVLSSDHEGLPGVLIEALACGTPVVSTDCPSGPREILAAFPECLVPCNDPVALAAAIRRALAAPPDAARADLSAYAADGVAAAYERLAAEAR